MSYFNPFYDHPLIVGIVIAISGFGVGFGVNQYFSDHYNKVETVAKESLSKDVGELQGQVLSQDQTIQSLSSQLATARDELVSRSSKNGSDGMSIQLLNQKYTSLSGDYNQLSGMYKSLQGEYRKAEQNCNALNRIGFLEQKGRNLENQLRSVGSDVFDKNPEVSRQNILMQLNQNHEQLMSLQQQLSR